MRYLFMLSLLFGSASALDFGKLQIEKGYAGPLVVDVEWSAGSSRDVTGATGTLTVYKTPPVAGVGGTTLFTCTLTPVGTPTYRMSCTITAANVAVPGSYFAELVVTEGSNRDPAHGTVVVEGR